MTATNFSLDELKMRKNTIDNLIAKKKKEFERYLKDLASLCKEAIQVDKMIKEKNNAK